MAVPIRFNCCLPSASSPPSWRIQTNLGDVSKIPNNFAIALDHLSLDMQT